MTDAAIALLPPAFADLESFVADWALPTTAARAERRTLSTAAERITFHDALAPRLEAALAHLDTVGIARFESAERNLMHLCLMLAHIALAIETLGEDEASHAPHRDAMRITRAPADHAITPKVPA